MSAEKSGRLAIATPEQTYLRHGIFEPAKMVDGLREEIEKSLTEGYAAFRGTGELGWAASLPSVLLRLYEYETMFDEKLSPFFIALCQYNETLFPSQIISQMLRIHPKIVARDQLRENAHYLGPRKSLDQYPEVSVDQVLGTGVSCAA